MRVGVAVLDGHNPPALEFDTFVDIDGVSEKVSRSVACQRAVMTTARPRSRTSAKAAGTRFESLIAVYLREHLDDRIERRARTGGKDRGDLSGVRAPGGGRIVVEAKNTSRIALGAWAAEAETERGNDDALVGVIAHKRVGKGSAGDQWITMTVRDLVALLSGTRPPE